MAKISIRNLNAYYEGLQALKNINLDINEKEILGIIGPANSGKSSILRALNRLIEFDDARVEGEIRLDGKDIHGLSVNDLRRRVGLIFASPVVLPGTIYKNITFGPKLHRHCSIRELDDLVYFALSAANLWDEVKDRLYESASQLSGGQQQRLCIARSLALKPEERTIHLHPRHQQYPAGGAGQRPGRVLSRRRADRAGPDRKDLHQPQG
jgi:phosphate transport system ATP-binding protein